MRKNRFNNRNHELIHNGDLGGYNVNCWGSTVAYHDDEFEPRWLIEREIDDWLDENTKKVKGKLKKGDILVMRHEFGTIIHTAIYINKNKVWHKPGAQDAEFTTIAKSKNEYRHHGASIFYYVRVRK